VEFADDTVLVKPSLSTEIGSYDVKLFAQFEDYPFIRSYSRSFNVKVVP